METNLEHTIGYGCDPYTQQAKEAIRTVCQAPNALVQFMEGGTQTNVTVIDALLRRHEGVLIISACALPLLKTSSLNLLSTKNTKE